MNNNAEITRILLEMERQCRNYMASPVAEKQIPSAVGLAEELMDLAKQLKWQAYAERRNTGYHG